MSNLYRVIKDNYCNFQFKRGGLKGSTIQAEGLGFMVIKTPSGEILMAKFETKDPDTQLLIVEGWLE